MLSTTVLNDINTDLHSENYGLEHNKNTLQKSSSFKILNFKDKSIILKLNFFVRFQRRGKGVIHFFSNTIISFSILNHSTDIY